MAPSGEHSSFQVTGSDALKKEMWSCRAGKISDAHRIQLQLRNDQDKLTRYFYETCCMVTGKIETPHVNNLYAVNIHASAFATDDTKQKHIVRFQDETEKDRCRQAGGL